MTTSSVPGGRRVVRRDGYRVIRRAGRYSVFPRSILSGAVGRIGTGDGVVEIWNGMPFFSPLWSRSPQITFLHHVHAEMWKMVLPRGLAEAGHLLEHRIAPPFYRRSRIVTLSESSKAEIVERLHLPADRITVTPPGVEPRFTPGRRAIGLAAGGGGRPPGAGQAVPPPRRGAGPPEGDHPDLRAVIAGEGLRAAGPRGRSGAARRRGTGSNCPAFVDDDVLRRPLPARLGRGLRPPCARAGG